MDTVKPRLNTRLESEGAEFLVLGNLLMEGILAYKAYHNFKSYDLVAINQKTNKAITIQVKSRYKTDWGGFIINDFDCDFVVFVALNRGYKKIKKNGDDGKKAPEYYIFPVAYVKAIERSGWGKISKSKLLDYSDYLYRWDLISKSLQ